MKILLVSCRSLTARGQPRVNHLRLLCEALSERHRVHVCHMAIRESRALSVELETKIPGVEGLTVLEPPGNTALLMGIVRALLTLRPVQSTLYATAQNKERLRASVRKFEPDAIIYDTLRAAAFHGVVAKSGTLQILDMDDLFSVRYARMLNQMKIDNLLGNAAAHLPYAIRRIAKVLARPILKYESRTLDALERAAPRVFEHVILMSRRECEILRQRAARNNVHWVPLFIPNVSFAGSDPTPAAKLGLRDGDTDDSLCFVGNFSYAPNIASLRYILDEVVPRIERLRRGTILRVIGGNLPDDLCWQITQRDDVEYLGYQEDLEAAVRRCGAFLCPILFGSGVKTKIVEAMSWGVPVVSNRIGLEGLDVIDGVHCLQADTPDEQAAAAISLLENRERAQAIADAARCYVRQIFNGTRCLRLWEGLVETPRSSG